VKNGLTANYEVKTFATSVLLAGSADAETFERSGRNVHGSIALPERIRFADPFART